MADSLDIDAMITRFRERAHAVKQRPLPPVAGDERARFVKQAQIDFRDYAIIGDAQGAIDGKRYALTAAIGAGTPAVHSSGSVMRTAGAPSASKARISASRLGHGAAAARDRS